MLQCIRVTNRPRRKRYNLDEECDMGKDFVIEFLKIIFQEEVFNDIEFFDNEIIIALENNNKIKISTKKPSVIEGCVQKMFQVEK